MATAEQRLQFAGPKVVRIVVYGIAKPSGSKRAFIRGGHATIVDANPNSRDWKNSVADAAAQAYAGELLDGPLRATFRFYRPRPAGHFNTKGELNKKGLTSPYPVSAPDVLKLSRGVEDAMKGIVYSDDSRIVREVLEKNWGTPARCEIVIEEISHP